MRRMGWFTPGTINTETTPSTPTETRIALRLRTRFPIRIPVFWVAAVAPRIVFWNIAYAAGASHVAPGASSFVFALDRRKRFCWRSDNSTARIRSNGATTDGHEAWQCASSPATIVAGIAAFLDSVQARSGRATRDGGPFLRLVGAWRVLTEHVAIRCKASSGNLYRRVFERFILAAYRYMLVEVEQEKVSDLHWKLREFRYQANRAL